MTTKEVNRLIDKYMEGKTSPDEERRLALEVNRPDAPEEWKVIGEMLGELTLGEAIYEHTLSLRCRRRVNLRMGWAAAAFIAYMAISGYFEYRRLKAEQAAELAQTTEHTAPKEVPASKPKAATVLPTGMMAHTASDMKPRTDVQSSKAPKRKRRKPSSAPLPTPIIEGVQTTEVPSVMPLPQVSEKEMAQVERNFQQWQLRQTVLGEGIEMRMATERLNKKYEEYLAANKDNIEI